MKYSNIMIADLTSIEACDQAIEAIESDYHNTAGGWEAWNSGYSTYLLAGAEKKIEAIRRKSDRLWNQWIKAQYAEYKKQNGRDAVSLADYEENELYY